MKCPHPTWKPSLTVAAEVTQPYIDLDELEE